jgi:UPF0716 protein FxsA
MLSRLFVLAFLVLPIVEIAIFILVGQAIGVWPTLLLVVLSTFVGLAVIRRRGLALLRSIREAMGQRRLPAQAIADTMLAWTGGALLVIPGLLTSLFGLVLLLEPVRRLAYALLRRLLGLGHGGNGVGPAGPPPGGEARRTIDLEDEHFRPRGE